jgi:hypothetical protein
MNLLKLVSKPSHGNLILEYPKKESSEVFEIGEARLSLSKNEEFSILNFWLRTEYECEVNNNELVLVWGPTLEIVTKIDKKLKNLNGFELEIEYCNPQQDMFFDAHYYNQFHQSLKNTKLSFKITDDNLYLVNFVSVPYEEEGLYLIKGECKLLLLDELKRYW